MRSGPARESPAVKDADNAWRYVTGGVGDLHERMAASPMPWPRLPQRDGWFFVARSKRISRYSTGTSWPFLTTLSGPLAAILRICVPSSMPVILSMFALLMS